MVNKPNIKPRGKINKPGRPPVGTPDWAPDFIGALMIGHSVIDATLIAGVDLSMPYRRRTHDEKFKLAWKEACDIGTEYMEQEAARRAYHGTLEPVFHKGEQCGLVRKYSDTLMIFLLKARKPDVYKDTSTSVTVNNNKNLTLNVFDDIERNIKLIEAISDRSVTTLPVDTTTDSNIRADSPAQPVDEAQSTSAESPP